MHREEWCLLFVDEEGARLSRPTRCIVANVSVLEDVTNGTDDAPYTANSLRTRPSLTARNCPPSREALEENSIGGGV